MGGMKAAVWHGYKDIRIEMKPIPIVPEGHVLVKVMVAGICGTDRHEYVGPNFIPAGRAHRLTGRTAPLTLGHEFSGEIAALGKGVQGWKAGDRVTANGTLCCKVCPMCLSGRYNICEKLGFMGVSDDGAFAEYVIVDADRLFQLPDQVSYMEAVLAEPLACGLHATGLLGCMRGKSVAVIGPGIIGLSCMLAAKFADAARILVIGVGTHRKELVESCCYRCAYLDVQGKDAGECAKEWNGGAFDVVYECVGSQQALDSAVALTAPGGKLMVMGVFENKPVFDMNAFQEGERMLFTSQAHVDEIGCALQWIAQGRVRAKELITRVVTLDTLVQDGFEELLQHGPEHIKILINIGENAKNAGS